MQIGGFEKSFTPVKQHAPMCRVFRSRNAEQAARMILQPGNYEQL